MQKKTGVYSWVGYFSDFRQRLEWIRAAGFDGLMLWWEDDTGPSPYSRREMAAMTKEADLELFNAHIAGIHENFIWSEDRALREKHLFLIRDTIAEIAEVGIDNLVVHLCESSDVPPPGKYLFQSVEYLIPFAQEYNVTLSLENTWRSDYLEAVWREFPVDCLGFCFDSSHANLRGQFDLLATYYDRLTALHLSDNDGLGDRHWLPFDGEIDFATLVTPSLKKTDVPYTMELISDTSKYPDEKAFLVEAKKRVDRLLALETVL